MLVLLQGLAILLALLLVLLAVPITVAFSIERIREIRGHVNLRWLFGLVRVRMTIPGGVDSTPKRQRRREKISGKRKRAGNSRGAITLLKQSAFRSRAVRLVKDLLRKTHPHDLYLRLRIGLGDPADTGRLWVLLGPVAGIAASLRSAEIRIEPEFMDPMLEIEGRGEFRLVPLQFIALIAAFAVSPTTLRAYRSLRGARR